MATDTTKFNWRTRAKVTSLDISGKRIHTLADHETDINAHPGFARKGDSALADPKIKQAIAEHRGDAMAHALHYTRRNEVIGGDGCTDEQAIQQYEAAKETNLNTTSNGTAAVPIRHVVTAWLLNKVLQSEVFHNIDTWWKNLCKNIPTTVEKLWTFKAGISASEAVISDVKGSKALCADENGKVCEKIVDTAVTKGSENLVTSGAVEAAISGESKAHTHGQIANNGDVTMRETPKDADPTNVRWVSVTWWDSVRNAAVSFLNNLTVSGILTANGGLQVANSQETQLGKTTIGTGSDHKDLSVNGNLSVADSETVDGSLLVKGDTTVGQESTPKTLSVKGDTNVSGSTTLGADGKDGGSLTVYGDAEFKKGVIVPDRADASKETNDVNLSSAANLRWVITRITNWWATTTAAAISFYNTLTVDGKITGKGGLEIANDQTTQLGATTIGKTGGTKSLTVNGDSSVTGNSSVGGNETVGGNVSVTGTITAAATIDDSKNDTTVPTTSWVRTRISTWWTAICNAPITFNSTLTVKDVLTAAVGLVAKTVQITDVKNADALCTDADGIVKAKTVDTTPTENSANLITSGGVFSWVKSYVSDWWTSICNAAVVFKSTLSVTETITSETSISAPVVKISNTKNARALCTDGTGSIISKGVDTEPKKGSDNLITSGGVHDAISSEIKTHSHGQISNDGDVTMKAVPADTDPTNVKWVIDKLASWWTAICNAPIEFKSTLDITGILTALSGIEAPSVKITDLTDAGALGTDANGSVVKKDVDTTVTKDSANLITSGAVAAKIEAEAKHTHGQIANNGDVTMKEFPASNDPTNVEYVLAKIQEGGGSNFKDYPLDISTFTPGTVVDIPTGTDTNLNVGMYDLILRMTFGEGENTVTVDITDPTAEVSSMTMQEDIPIYVPGKSLLIIHKNGLKFRVPKSWMNFYGTFTIDGKQVTMDTTETSTEVLKLSSYVVVARRVYAKF